MSGQAANPPAPTFDRDTLNLIHFFNEVDTLATEASLNDQAKIRQSLRYAQREEYKLWGMLTEATSVDFATF